MTSIKSKTVLKGLLRFLAAGLIIAVLLQMGAVSVTHARCAGKGTERIALGDLAPCCSHELPDFPALSQKCCDIEKSEAVFFSLKNSDKERLGFEVLFVATAFTLIADASVSVPLRYAQVHLKIPPDPGKVVLLRDCRLNV